MEPRRRSYRIDNPGHRHQAGITALAALMLATVFGLVGLAAIKVTPLYVQGMRIRTVLEDLKEELDGRGTTANALRLELSSRLYVEGVRLSREDVKITPAPSGYNLRVQYDNRTQFLADIWFLVIIDEQIEIQR
ncbi:MAG: DUF4845 domain-containing protein [Gammaproteobacteria bacterium]